MRKDTPTGWSDIEVEKLRRSADKKIRKRLVPSVG
jgi:hypothetical protein